MNKAGLLLTVIAALIFMFGCVIPFCATGLEVTPPPAEGQGFFAYVQEEPTQAERDAALAFGDRALPVVLAAFGISALGRILLRTGRGR